MQKTPMRAGVGNGSAAYVRKTNVFREALIELTTCLVSFRSSLTQKITAVGDRLRLKRQHALVHAPQRLTSGGAVERFKAVRDLADGERAICAEASPAQALKVFGLIVVRPEMMRRCSRPRHLIAGFHPQAARG